MFDFCKHVCIMDGGYARVKMAESECLVTKAASSGVFELTCLTKEAVYCAEGAR